MFIQKILLSVVSNFVVGLWDGLDECDISWPEILSQSAPVYMYHWDWWDFKKMVSKEFSNVQKGCTDLIQKYNKNCYIVNYYCYLN